MSEQPEFHQRGFPRCPVTGYSCNHSYLRLSCRCTACRENESARQRARQAQRLARRLERYQNDPAFRERELRRRRELWSSDEGFRSRQRIRNTEYVARRRLAASAASSTEGEN
jgi:hypothetical protein